MIEGQSAAALGKVPGLDQYIVESLPDEDVLLDELNLAIKRTRSMFAAVPFREQTDGWGYRVVDDEAEKLRKEPAAADQISQSTVSMIVASLMRDKLELGMSASSGFPWDRYPEPGHQAPNDELDKRISAAIKLLARSCLKDSKLILKSTTYGDNDILSLSWHYDIFRSQLDGQNDNEFGAIVKACEDALVARAKAYVGADSGYLAICESFRDPTTPLAADARVGESSYILLRFVRCLKVVSASVDDPMVHSAISRAAKRLQSKLHDQLSLAEITDSRFDPAELAFCLEGLLHLRPEQVDYSLLDRVLTVLGKAQAQSAYWRSETPIVIQQRGHVLFPIGVETARSILNSIALFAAPRDGHSRRLEITPAHLRLMKRYWAWLKGRQTAIRKGSDLLHGWHSEHVNDTSLVHTWETSQILEFLLAFRRILKTHIADRLLVLSRLDVRRPGRSVNWKEVVEKFEPYTREPHNIYARIGSDFVEPRQFTTSVRPRSWSMLLYGPPGTGKSTVAENLGDCLGVPVITVTVSDFLGEGESRMEARVKNIFTVIERQLGAIVLFDEMDQFLLDRNSELFRAQDSVFQFLTPGMLTKFARLRRAETVIFIIATNFEERIDPAIKRTGRIDHRYLVLPPDNARRTKLLGELCRDIVSADAPDDIEQLLEASCLLAFTDIKNAAAAGPTDIGDLEKALRDAVRNVQFGSLAERGKVATKGFEEEILALLTLIDEAHPNTVSTGGDWDGKAAFLAYMDKTEKDSVYRKYFDGLTNEKLLRLGRGSRKSGKNSV